MAKKHLHNYITWFIGSFMLFQYFFPSPAVFLHVSAFSIVLFYCHVIVGPIAVELLVYNTFSYMLLPCKTHRINTLLFLYKWNIIENCTSYEPYFVLFYFHCRKIHILPARGRCWPTWVSRLFVWWETGRRCVGQWSGMKTLNLFSIHTFCVFNSWRSNCQGPIVSNKKQETKPAHGTCL